MTRELTRQGVGELRLRAAPEGVEQRIVEGVVIPFGQTTTVADPEINHGRPYRESIRAGAQGELDPATVTLESGRHGGELVGRGIEARETPEGLWMALRVSRTQAGNELLELARDRVYRSMSAVFRPVREIVRGDGVTERTAIDLRRVAVLETGAYPGAQVTAVRSATEGETMADDPVETGQADATADDEQASAPTPPTPIDSARPNRTRVTVDVERADRAAAERDTVRELSRGAPSGGGIIELARGPMGLPGITITRSELIYGPGSGQSWLRDFVGAYSGDGEAAARYHRHGRLLDEIGGRIVELGRAGDFLSSEAGGAYPNVYLPGLLTPRVLKGRPMGGFYNNYPIANAAPQIFPKATTATVVAAQGSEGAALSSTDYATTAVSTTPTLYGAYIDVSRQVIDGGSPAADAMVYADLIEAYAQATEAAIKTAVEAGSSASGAAIVAATPFAGTLANVVAYYGARFKPAQAQFVPSALFTTLVTQLDSTGRPLLPSVGAINSSGTLADGAAGAGIAGAETYLSYASTANVVVTARADDFVIFESPVVRFSYDQIVGPQAVRIGVWAYLGIGTRLGSLKVTAA